MRSSYKKNNYGQILRSLVLAHKPTIAVECGVLDGYSTFHIAHALRFLNKRKKPSFFYAFDLWGKYPYKHGNYSKVKFLLEKQKLSEFVRLRQGNAFEVHKYFPKNSVDFLHVDISNDGDVLLKILHHWEEKLAKDGIIAFEGGSYDRDRVEWMLKFNKRPIKSELINNPKVYTKWDVQVMTPFPSMTLLWKKI